MGSVFTKEESGDVTIWSDDQSYSARALVRRDGKILSDIDRNRTYSWYTFEPKCKIKVNASGEQFLHGYVHLHGFYTAPADAH